MYIDVKNIQEVKFNTHTLFPPFAVPRKNIICDLVYLGDTTMAQLIKLSTYQHHFPHLQIWQNFSINPNYYNRHLKVQPKAYVFLCKNPS